VAILLNLVKLQATFHVVDRTKPLVQGKWMHSSPAPNGSRYKLRERAVRARPPARPGPPRLGQPVDAAWPSLHVLGGFHPTWNSYGAAAICARVGCRSRRHATLSRFVLKRHRRPLFGSVFSTCRLSEGPRNTRRRVKCGGRPLGGGSAVAPPAWAFRGEMSVFRRE